MSLTQHDHTTAMPGSSLAGTLRSCRFLQPAELLEQAQELPVQVLRQLQDPRWLAAIAELFVADQRPESRALLLRYLRAPLNAPGHEIFIRKLLKQAEANADDQVLGLLLVALDRTIRRRIRPSDSDKSMIADPSENALPGAADSTRKKIILRTPAGTILPRLSGVTPVTDAFVVTIDSGKADDSASVFPQCLFTVTTRRFLQRRLWRYFHKLGQKFPDRYANAAFMFLQEYCDNDTPDGLSLLDCHGLMQCLFGHSAVVIAAKTGWKLRPENRLADLTAAPAFPEIWQQVPLKLWQLARSKNSRVVRQWATQLLQREHSMALAQFPVTEILELLTIDDPDTCRLALALLENDRQWQRITAGQWKDLVSAMPENNAAAITPLLQRTLDSAETQPEIRRAILCSARPEQATAALQSIVVRSPDVTETAVELLELTALASAYCTSVITQWVWSIIESCALPAADRLVPLLENPQISVRLIAMEWLNRQPLLWSAPELTQRMLQSDYPDVCQWLVTQTDTPLGRLVYRHAEFPSVADALARLWRTVTSKPSCTVATHTFVLQQVAWRLQKNNAEQTALLPILIQGLHSAKTMVQRQSLVLLTQLTTRNPQQLPSLEAQGIRLPQAFSAGQSPLK
jgi:hypothetical protein